MVDIVKTPGGMYVSIKTAFIPVLAQYATSVFECDPNGNIIDWTRRWEYVVYKSELEAYMSHSDVVDRWKRITKEEALYREKNSPGLLDFDFSWID